MDEVSCKFEVGPRHCAQSVLMAAWLSVTRCATSCNIDNAGGQSGRPSAFGPRHQCSGPAGIQPVSEVMRTCLR